MSDSTECFKLAGRYEDTSFHFVHSDTFFEKHSKQIRKLHLVCYAYAYAMKTREYANQSGTY